MNFAARLRQARLDAGLSQADLAGSRYSVSYISHLESGRRTPTSDILRHLEKALQLGPGELGGASDLSRPQQRRADAGDVFARYCAAMDYWRAGVFVSAFEEAQAVRAALPAHGREDLASLVTLLLVDINLDLGHYVEASEEAQRHLERARSTGSTTLTARAACQAARAARMAGQLDLATSAATEALNLTRSLSDDLRAHALMAAIAVEGGAGADVSSHVAELESIVDSLPEGNTRGSACWVLGNVALREGRVEEGVERHRRADLHLNPNGDFRNWARFPRAAAEEQVEAGVDTGIDDLLTEGERRLRLLDNPDELAALTIVRARHLHRQGQHAAAVREVDSALEEADLPPVTQGHLHALAAQIHLAEGRADAGRTSALKAARLYTEAGDTERATAAWELLDQASGTGT